MNPAYLSGAPDVSPRPRLLNDVDRAIKNGDLLIVAGAGFGKRSLIRSWAVETDGPAIKWLEVSDQLPAPTWQGVVIAVGIHEAALDALGKSGRAWRLILVAGHEPETDLSVAKLNGMLTVLDADNLRMTDTEIADLLPNATPSEVARTIEATGGWPVAVQALASRLAHHEDMAQLESEFSNLTAAIFDFCESHVLEAADARERAFLTSLSAMPELDLRLAERLVGEESGKAAVETAVRFGLVRRKPNKGYCWSQCHTVLARHLQALETELRPDAIRKLHDIAADHFSAGEEHELAIYHAYAAENWPKVATYIERAGGWRLAVDLRNRLSSRDWLYNCIEDLPETCVKDSPALQLARAMLRFCCGEIRPAMRDYEQLLAARTGLDETLDLEVTIVGLLMRMLEERPPSSSRRREIQHCLKRIPSTDAMSIALMENALSIAAAQRGETDDALESAERARRLYVRVGAKESVSVVGLLQGRICAQAGLRNLALQHLRGAQTAFEQQLGFNSDLARCARLLIGHQALASNDLQTARDYTSDVLPWVEAQEPQFHAAAYLSCAKLAVLDNGLDAGARVIDTCIRFAQRRGLERLERLAQICWLEQLCGAGEAKAAAHLAHETQLQDLVENQSDPLLAQHAAFTLAEIEIGCGEPAAAQARLAAFQRSKCWIESTSARIKKHLLSALIYHLMDGETAAHGEIKEAIRLAAPEGLPRLFIARGAEMYTLLRSFQKADPQKGRFANHVHDEFVSDVLSSIRREQRTNRISAEGIALTTKEEEIVELVTKGLSNKEIARLVDASDNTVKWHLKNLFRRFEVSSRDELATAYHINLTKRRNHNIHVSMASLRIQ